MPEFKNRLLLVSFLLHYMTGFVELNAQESPLRPTFHYDIFDLPGGTAGNDLQAIAQDSFGFMWFGSQFGLHRWDGYHLKTFLKDPEDSSSIASDYIECLYVAKDGTLWIGHWGNGLDRFDHKTETFKHYDLNLGDANNNSNNLVSAMTEDRDGRPDGILRRQIYPLHPPEQGQGITAKS